MINESDKSVDIDTTNNVLQAKVQENNIETTEEAKKSFGFDFDLESLESELEVDKALNEKEKIPVTPEHSCAVVEEKKIENPDFLNESNLINVWSKLMLWFKNNEQNNLHELLLENIPLVEGKSLILTLDSAIEKEIIVGSIGQIKGFLKRHFSDFEELKLEVTKSTKSKKIILNQKDKFIKLAKKNPWLNELRKELDLELEL